MQPSYDAALLYTYPDRPIVDAIVQALRAHGASFWWDDDRSATEAFSLSEMYEVLSRANYVVALVSPNTYESSWVQRELELAHSMRKPIIACLIGDRYASPSRLSKLLPKGGALHHYLDLRGRRGDPFDPRALEELEELLFPTPRSAALPQNSEATYFPGWTALITTTLVVMLLALQHVRATRLLDTLGGLQSIAAGLLSLLKSTISAERVILAGAICLGLGAVTSGARALMDLLAAWIIVKRIRAEDRSSRTPPTPTNPSGLSAGNAE